MIKRFILSSLLAVKLATPSDDIGVIDEMENIQSYVNDQALSERITGFFQNLFAIEEEPVEIDIAEDTDYKSMPMLLAATKKAENTYKNVVVYTGRFDNTECRLIIPYNGFSSLSVIDGYLVNVGTSSLTGRILYNDDELDPDSYDTYSYVLNPVYNSPSNVYRYGSYNYRRHYYVNNMGISYSDTYGKFYVDDVKIYYNDSSRTYYALLVVLFMFGISFIRGKK